MFIVFVECLIDLRWLFITHANWLINLSDGRIGMGCVMQISWRMLVCINESSESMARRECQRRQSCQRTLLSDVPETK